MPGVPVRSARTEASPFTIWPSGQVLPSPRVLSGSSWVIPVTVIVIGSPSGSVTPQIETGTYLWLGGHSVATHATALSHFGGRLHSQSDCAVAIDEVLKF